MTHWDYIWIAYGLTAAALALELVLLFQRRRRARQMLEDQQDTAGDLQA
ncbi:MAG: heme exporter protein CcmD [Lautropia sp.]|nr:heme exporter protein CcmD [Lautropia sp.]